MALATTQVPEQIDFTAPKLQLYTNIAQKIESYGAWIEAQSLPTEAVHATYYTAASQSLNNLKETYSNWINKIYPDYLTIPNIVDEKSQVINNNLKLLILMAKELKLAPEEKQLKIEIIKYTNALSTPVKELYKAISELSSLLNKFQVAFSEDCGKLSQMISEISLATSSEQIAIAAYYGQIQHLQKDHCPSDAKIKQAQEALRETTAVLAASHTAYKLFAEIRQSSSNIEQGLAYLSQYWKTVAAEASRTVLIMKQVDAKVDILLEMDLEEMSKNWQKLVHYYQELYQNIQHLKLIK